MEYREFPMVEGIIDRRFVYTDIKWLNKKKFEEKLSDKLQMSTYSASVESSIHPYIINTFSDNIGSKPKLQSPYDDSNKIFIGKTIPKSPLNNSLVNYSTSSNEIDTSYEYFEIVGSVYKANGSWRLRITHNEQVYEIENDFLVLCIDDPDSYYWDSNIDHTANQSFYMFTTDHREIPKFAYRAAIDMQEGTYTYIGRTIAEACENGNDEFKLKFKRPKFYANAWLHFNYNIPQTFGKIKLRNKMLFAPVQNLNLGFDQFKLYVLKHHLHL